jgi:hypothetical protein
MKKKQFLAAVILVNELVVAGLSIALWSLM